MNENHLTARLLVLLFTSAVFSGTTGLAAQPVNLSDASMTIITTSDLLAGSFTEPGTTFGFNCPMAWGVRTAADRVAGWYTGTVEAPDPFSRVSNIQSLSRLLAVEAPSSTPRDEVLAALTRDNREAQAAAEDLVDELDRLLAVVRTLDPTDPDPAVARRLSETVADFNRFVRASSATFLNNPPAEFLALRATIGELVRAAADNATRDANPAVVDQAGLACAPGLRAELPPPPREPQLTQICVMDSGDLRVLSAIIAESGEPMLDVGERLVPVDSIYPEPGAYADDAEWYRAGEPIVVNSVTYAPWGEPRADPAAPLRRVGDFRGVPLMVAVDPGIPDEEIVYVPLRNCVVREFRQLRNISGD